MKQLRMLCVVSLGLVWAGVSSGLTLETKVPGLDFVKLMCNDPTGWTFDWRVENDGAGVSVLKIRMVASDERTPPKFSVRLGLPGVRADHVWSAFDDRYMLYCVGFSAESRYESQLAYRTPLITVFDDDNRNTIALACSEALRKLKFGIGISERTCVLRGAFHFFEVEEPPMEEYAVEIRIDRRDCFWANAVSEASDWITSVNGFTPCRVPEAAFDPLYSSWYAFWQDVSAASVEKEIPIAASLGMKTAILDDGWQKKKSASFYSATGDWMPFAGTFPDMKRHVDFVHQAGLKYMLWLSVPYVGDETAAWKRFEGKFLRIRGEKSPGRVGVLDPRFPEVREYLIGTYERILRDWRYDGLKLDFIDQFVIKDEDPAVGQKFAGRDIRSLPLAVDRLMKDVVKRLSAINPDVLLEFRQQYMGPAILQYGNMIRATDSPADSDRIRKQIADLRLTSGNAAVHADMLAWSREETPERAARPILNSLFSVIQYSMKLDGLPESHCRVIKHWIDFTQRHRAALVKGVFRPYHPELLYPCLEGESADEKVIALYSAPQPVDIGNVKKPVVLVNATFETLIPVVLSVPATARLFDVFGQVKDVVELRSGVQMLAVPVSGFAEIHGISKFVESAGQKLSPEFSATQEVAHGSCQVCVRDTHRPSEPTSLNDGWTADGVPVTLPHCWNVEDGTDGPTDPECWNHDSVAGTGYARRKVVYRRELLPSEKTRWLRVNAASIHAVVRVDGHEVGRHAGAFAAFTVEVPRGGKVVEIEVDNFYDPDVPPVCGDFTMYGGLYRGVDLLDEPETFPAPTDLPNYEFRGDGFYVNGVKTFLKGVCYHQDREGKGWAISAEDEEEDIKLIKAMGANAIRTSHYPRSERFYDLCDKYGIYVWTEIPLVDATTASETFRSNTLQVAREMVLQHRHHKCIAMWGIFNELYLKKMPDGQAEPLVREVKELIRSLDPRPIVAASNNPKKKELNAIPDALGFNMYPGWYIGESTDLGREIEEWRKANRRSCVAISEYGAGGSLGQPMPSPDYRPQPDGKCHPVDYQLKHHQASWAAIKANPHVWGCFVWVMFDAGSDNRHEGARSGINDKGLVGFDHKTLKSAYEFYRREWSK